MIAAAWGAWHSRHGGKLGPGAGFVEAISAAMAACPELLRLRKENACLRGATNEEAAKVAEIGDWYGQFQTSGDERRAQSIATRIRALAIDKRREAMTEADHELDLHTTAYKVGLEIRYAVAASGADPIEHLPELDDILEQKFIEIRRAALDEAARAAEQCGRPTGASDGSTFIPGTSADAARAIRALPGAARQ
jgi:hypothetical protein